MVEFHKSMEKKKQLNEPKSRIPALLPACQKNKKSMVDNVCYMIYCTFKICLKHFRGLIKISVATKVNGGKNRGEKGGK